MRYIGDRKDDKNGLLWNKALECEQRFLFKRLVYLTERPQTTRFKNIPDDHT